LAPGQGSPTVVTRQGVRTYEQRTLHKGFDQYNPNAVAEHEAEDARRR
jgi:hypothetical protein